MRGSFANLAWYRQLAWVVSGSLLLALLLVPVLERLFGRAVWQGLAWSWAGCVVPGCVIIVLVAAWPLRWSSLGLVAIAMALRIVAAGGALYHMELQLRLERGNSLTWLTLYYLLMLVVESGLLVNREDRDNYQQRKRRRVAGIGSDPQASATGSSPVPGGHSRSLGE
ncbi:MAG: hypothetical protein ACKOJF_23835 [Planctomycetaceae bacterium]